MGVLKIEKDGIIRLRGQPIGQLTAPDEATVDAAALGSAANRWLLQKGVKVTWQEGVIQQLEQAGQKTHSGRGVRIYQLNADADRDKRFAGYRAVTEQFGGVEAGDYHCVFDGDLGTENLEEIFTHCNLNLPENYIGHSLSVSDVVELYGGTASRFHYVDSFGFEEIPFAPQRVQNHQPGLAL